MCTQTTIVVPFAACPLAPLTSPRQTAPQPRGATEQKAADCAPYLFCPPNLTYCMTSLPFPPSTIPISTQFQIQIRFMPLPSRLPLRAFNLCLAAKWTGAPGVAGHVLTIRPSPGHPAVRPPFRNHGGRFSFDLTAGSLALEKIGN